MINVSYLMFHLSGYYGEGDVCNVDVEEMTNSEMLEEIMTDFLKFKTIEENKYHID